MEVTIEIDIAEENDGYQYIFLYPNSVTSSSILKTSTGDEAKKQFDLGGTGAQSSYSRKTVTFTFDLANLNTHQICVRYGADGVGDDTWYNRDLKVTIKIF